MKVSLNALLTFIQPTAINLPDQWPLVLEILEDIGLEVKRVEHIKCEQDHLKDIQFTLELLANRGDHHCYQGIAREIHGRTAWPLKALPQATTPLIDPSSFPINLAVESDLCLDYSLTEYALVDNDAQQSSAPVQVKELTPAQHEMIQLAGSNLVSPAVDITNLVNAEFGQPMHVFDADTIKGSIEVRLSKTNESALFLGATQQTTLPVNTLVIADQAKILAVAGVIGCDESKPTTNTKRIYLESATFDPVAVRQAARALGLQTLSSARFERGGDIELAQGAIARANYLLNRAGWQLIEGAAIFKSTDLTPAPLHFSIDDLNQFFDSNFTVDTITERLERYGFIVQTSDYAEDEVTDFAVTPPSYRYWDVKAVEDIYEEIAKSVGYNQLPSRLPESAAGVLPSPEFIKQLEVEKVLLNHGLYEVFTDGFYSDNDVARLGLNESHTLMQHVRINNSETKAYSLLKSNNLVQALDMVALNLNIKNSSIKAFEWNRKFIKDLQAINGICEEERVLWGLICGNATAESWQDGGKSFDLYALKYMITQVSHAVAVPLTLDHTANLTHPYLDALHPKRRAVIVAAGQVVGVVGEFHPKVLKAFDIKSVNPIFFEISQSILTMDSQPRKYESPSNILPVTRNICLQVAPNFEAGQVSAFFQEHSTILQSANITDSFDLKDETIGAKAITYTLIYHPQLASKEVFASEELNTETDRLAEMAIAAFGSGFLARR